MNLKNRIALFRKTEGFHKKKYAVQFFISFLDEQNNLYSQCL